MFTDLLCTRGAINYSETAHCGKLILIIVENVHFVARICVIELNTELVSISTLATQGFSFLRLTEQQYDELLSQ